MIGPLASQVISSFMTTCPTLIAFFLPPPSLVSSVICCTISSRASKSLSFCSHEYASIGIEGGFDCGLPFWAVVDLSLSLSNTLPSPSELLATDGNHARHPCHLALGRSI